jgi:hypothetical protein
LEHLIREYNQKNKQTPLRLPHLKIILTGTEYGYRRDDGVLVIPLGCLKDSFVVLSEKFFAPQGGDGAKNRERLYKHMALEFGHVDCHDCGDDDALDDLGPRRANEMN